MSKTTKNDIPAIEEIESAMLEVLASGRTRSFDNIAGDVGNALGLSKAQRSYRIGKSKNTLFQNRLVQARTELTKEGAITYRSGKVKLVKAAKSGKVSETKPNNASGAKRAEKRAASSKAPEGRPTKCLSVREPYATFIATGVKDAEFRSKKVNTPIYNLVICSSKTPHPSVPRYLAGMTYGYAVCMVDIVDCVGVAGDHMWKLENPRLIKPFEVHASAGFYYDAHIPEIIPSTEEFYREHVLPFCYEPDSEAVDGNLASLFSKKPDEFQKALQLDREKFDLMRKRYPYTQRD